MNRSGVVLTSFSELTRFSKANSLWTFALPLSCCAVEFFSAVGSRYDWERFGACIEREPGNADLMIVAGPVTPAMAPEIIALYKAMLSPKYVIAMGSCANTGGIFAPHSEAVAGGVDKYLPVDVFVPGCPPRPEALIHGLIALQNKISDQGRIKELQ